MPKTLVVELIKFSVFLLNASPTYLLIAMTIDFMPIVVYLLALMRKTTIPIANNPEPLELSP